MRVVASVGKIQINAPDDAYYSFFNSPYIGHKMGGAVDIYPIHQEWGGAAFAPAAGKVIRIRKMRMGREKPFPTDDVDYGIALMPETSQSSIVRIMHVSPAVREGERIELGDQIGSIIRSRYFNYWTGPHYHVEIMAAANFLRSSKSLPFNFRLNRTIRQIEMPSSDMEIIITEVNDDRAIAYPLEKIHTEIGDLSGMSAQDGNGSPIGIIDAGLSHYEYGGVVGKNTLQNGESIHIGKYKVGDAIRTKDSVVQYRRDPSISISIDDIELRGISCFLYPPELRRGGVPPIVLIPKHYRDFAHTLEDDTCKTLHIRSDSILREFENRHKS